MRAITLRQAITCESAINHRCRCRCGGALHGAGRFEVAASFHDLDADDPHHVAVDRRRGRQLSLIDDLPPGVRLDVARLRPAMHTNSRTPGNDDVEAHTGVYEEMRLAV